MFDALKKRLDAIERVPVAALPRAAARIEAKLRADATTKRGNVPAYGPMGDVPIEATATADSIKVRAADWVMGKARDLGQPDEWTDILASEVRTAASEGK